LFWAKAETYWIRPADGRTFELLDLVRFKAGVEALLGFSQVPPADVVAYLHECAVLMENYAADVLGGNLEVCEDILITQRLNTLGPTSISEFVAKIRAEIQSLSAEERAPLEKALVSKLCARDLAGFSGKSRGGEVEEQDTRDAAPTPLGATQRLT